MSQDNSPLISRANAVRVLYKVIMPGLVLVLFLGVSSLTSRPKLAGSMFVDVLARIVISLWLAIAYYRLPDQAKKYRVYPNIEWKRSDISPAGKLLYVSMALWIAFGVGLVIWWGISVFLPSLKDASLPVAIVSGIIYALPLVARYQVLKL